MPFTLSSIRASALPRLVDHAAGTPLLWLWGVCRRRRPLPLAPRRFGLMMFETVGDTLLAGTLIASVREYFPAAELTAFVSQGNRGVVPLLTGIDTVVEVPLTRPHRALAAMRSVPVDVMIDIGQWPRWYAVLCAASRTSHTIGFATPGQSRHYAYDTAVPHGRDVHELENFQRLLRPLTGEPALPPQRALRPPSPQGRIEVRSPYIVVHPWASGFRSAAREWPLARWVELIARAAGLGVSVLVSGGAADRGRTLDLLTACRGLPVRTIAGDVSLAELAALLRGAAAVVAVNTGVMHLAALLDVPLVALHGPTSRLRWGPTGSRSIALAPASRTGCEFLHLGFEYPAGSVDCMQRIDVDEVFAALHPLLR